MAAVITPAPLQHINPLPQNQPRTCDRILKVVKAALIALAFIVFFTISPLAGAVTTALWLDERDRNNRQEGNARYILNGVLTFQVFNIFTYLNGLIF